MLGLAECWALEFFHSRLFLIRYGGKTENPNIQKIPNIRWSKTYLSSLWLSKTRKCSSSANKQMSNDRIHVSYINCKKLCIKKTFCKNLFDTSIPVFLRKTFSSFGKLAIVFSKRNFREREGFLLYTMYTECVFFKAFSPEMYVHQIVLSVHLALVIHKTDMPTWLNHKIIFAGNNLSSQFPWHRLPKCGTIE